MHVGDFPHFLHTDGKFSLNSPLFRKPGTCLRIPYTMKWPFLTLARSSTRRGERRGRIAFRYRRREQPFRHWTHRDRKSGRAASNERSVNHSTWDSHRFAGGGNDGDDTKGPRQH